MKPEYYEQSYNYVGLNLGEGFEFWAAHSYPKLQRLPPPHLPNTLSVQTNHLLLAKSINEGIYWCKAGSLLPGLLQ